MRISVPAACAALALATSGVLLPASPAAAADVFLEINPDTVRAGDEIGLRASCDDNLKEGSVAAEPIGNVPVAPAFGFLTATVTVPRTTEAGDYRVELTCSDGAKASSTLHVVARVEPSRGPATGGGGTARGGAAPLLLGGGGAVVAAGLALGLVAMRRRRLG
ncbi:hypothetical protein [Actinoplanes sp. RD1]|uniref:hypothetical protein n=1 Tax=Actinoplanes sp. RD1 TaxID=3064538 RepID=UPI0027414CF9|nr:hypothetical protein [Actinoplanes sp. RD1]